MRICAVKDLQPGDILGKSIVQANNRLLLGAGFRITSEIKDRLIEKGFSHVYIVEKGTEDIIPEDIISDEIRYEAINKLGQETDRIKENLKFRDMSYAKAVESLEKGNLKDIEISYEMKKIVKEIIDEITSTDTKFMTTLMPKSKDTFFFDHAINTTILSILLGKKFRYIRSELVDLALGSFLHDIGKVIIEKLENENNVDKNSSIDYYKEHPTFGYLLLQNDTSISPMVLQTVYQHHEQQGGKGFPVGLKGDNQPPVKGGRQKKGMIFRYAEICSVADAYDRKLLNPGKDGHLGPADVIKELLQSASTVYNKSVLEALTEIVPIYPVGSLVRINNIVDPSLIGCYGVVAGLNEDNLKRPKIIITTNKFKKKIKPVILDTTKLTHLELKLII
ncbi:HD-GYP domain-containing protein [Candidatus Latescibacterota bacterium]